MKKIFWSVFLVAAVLGASSCGPTLKQRKEEAAIHYRIGAVHLNDKNYTEALKELTQAVEKYPDDANYHNALGLAYFYRKMNREAIASMQKAVELNPRFSEAHIALSAVYLEEGRWDPAINEAREALSNIFYSTPEYAYFNIGRAYFNKGDYAGAIESYKKALGANPDYAVAYYNLGMAFDKTNNVKDAVSAYETAVRIFPDYIDAYFALGLDYIKLKNKAGAEQAFGQVIMIAPASEKAQSARQYIDLLK